MSKLSALAAFTPVAAILMPMPADARNVRPGEMLNAAQLAYCTIYMTKGGMNPRDYLQQLKDEDNGKGRDITLSEYLDRTEAGELKEGIDPETELVFVKRIVTDTDNNPSLTVTLIRGNTEMVTFQGKYSDANPVFSSKNITQDFVLTNMQQMALRHYGAMKINFTICMDPQSRLPQQTPSASTP